MKDVGTLYGHLLYFTAISYILWPFGKFCGRFGKVFSVLVCFTKKNLATLLCSATLEQNFFLGFHQNPVLLPTRVARWFNFGPKIPIWVNSGGP
jgi:hypothetical protein